MNTESQNKQILNHLQFGYAITALEAFKSYDCMRLAARISDIKKMGYNIKSEMVQVGNNKKKVARYSLMS